MAEKLDRIAFPGMTANFDAGKSASLALTMLDWRQHGTRYAKAMIKLAQRLAKELVRADLPVFASARNFTNSHQFAIEAAAFGGGQAASKKLRKAGFLACGIGLPIEPVVGDTNGLRIGTPELVRWGLKEKHMPRLAALIASALKTNDPETLAEEVGRFRREFRELHYICA